ncbi:serine O-acetyltransferase [Candidatus Endobugula sertula]|uniref:Serine acetyltransferase n=1 Tax=Candidatus Endobugula sertula TaxID=62101 RepID=A0A1D2QRS1_9GAMM|nr:serine O-acetyltransferase [Candidatus Endobugula sertula]
MSTKNTDNDPVWSVMRQTSEEHAVQEPLLASFFHTTILNHSTLEAALSFHLANKLGSPTASALLMREIIEEALKESENISHSVRADIVATYQRDSACDCLSTSFLFYKGFHALQAYRVANWLWANERYSLASFLQNHSATAFSVDIHPAAKIGKGIMLDHATGIVIGETAVVEDNVSIMQSVTLGGTGKETGDRHPKVREGVVIGAGAKILGNIEIGEGAHVSSGSVVLHSVPARTIVAGVPAKVIGEATTPQPALDMYQELRCKSIKL